MNHAPYQAPNRPARWWRSPWVHAAVGLPVAVAASLGAFAQTGGDPQVIPLINLATEPLYLNGAGTKPTLTLALSVEFPTVGATYRDNFTPDNVYIGYFDPAGCYTYVTNETARGPHFRWTSAAAAGRCGGSGFSGNFMNWATSSAIDILRFGLTGGDRVVDEAGGATVLQRAVIPTNFYRSGAYFPAKTLPANLVADHLPAKFAGNHTGQIHIANCLDRVHFGTQGTGSCASPGNNANLGLAFSANSPFFRVRNRVCDSATDERRPDLCHQYPNGDYKPIGELQRNADRLRVSVFGYLMDNNRSRYGGVLRAPMSYLGPRAFDADFNEVPGLNPQMEWDPQTGVFLPNPRNATEGVSGAINYLNRFGRLGQSNDPAIAPTQGVYKTLDPVSEMFYEALRYLQGQQPTPNAVSGTLTDAIKDDFPVYTTWSDPLPPMTDTSDYACIRNNILTIADVFTHSDKSVPGNTRTGNEDYARAVGTNEPNTPYWTRVVGGFEANVGVNYTSPDGTQRQSFNPNTPANTARWGMENQDTGATGGSYYIAGLAYWANTQDIRADRPGIRVRTFAIDVNENRASDDVTFRRNRQLYLAAKYGGFDDRANDGSPFARNANGSPDNSRWVGANGDARNYFKVDNAQGFLDSLRSVFARVVEETGSIAGGAVSSQRVTESGGSTYQALFDPRHWTGSIVRYNLQLDEDGVPQLSDTVVWDAGEQITATPPAERSIWVGRLDKSTAAANAFLWDDLEDDHRDALNRDPSRAGAPDDLDVDDLGAQRVDFLRGSGAMEIGQPGGIFRARRYVNERVDRRNVLGDVVNSGLRYYAGPDPSIIGTGYGEFYETHRNRGGVLYFGSNDGMLHAVNAANGRELFAYIPSFVVHKLNRLTDPNYEHTAYVDATPTIGEARVNGTWRTVLVSGVGGGAQGVFALDVTNPTAFNAGRVMWEFTQADDPDLGYVLGEPKVVKLRTSAPDVVPATYGWFAVFASGVNNYERDGDQFSASGDPAIFILDLGKPSASPWQLGTNYHKVVLPNGDNTRPKGLLNIQNVLGGAGETQYLYGGDLQGNLWKLRFTTVGRSSWTTSGLPAFSTGGVPEPLFVAREDDTAGGTRQVITGKPAVTFAPGGTRIVSFGTGKFLETIDLSSPFSRTSFYAILDNGVTQVSGRQMLSPSIVGEDMTITPTPFFWGMPNPESLEDTQTRAGWYFDFLNSTSNGERQISEVVANDRWLYFSTIFPATSGCGFGDSRTYEVDVLRGSGLVFESEVGIQAAPLVLEIGNREMEISDSTGQRTGRTRKVILTQGAKGLGLLRNADGSVRESITQNQYGRMSWREIQNFREIRNAP